jgi:uncharacterized protein YkvS
VRRRYNEDSMIVLITVLNNTYENGVENHTISNNGRDYNITDLRTLCM